MKTFLKMGFFLLAFLAVNLSVQAQHCKTSPACCAKGTAKVEKQDKSQTAVAQESATVVANVEQSADRATVPTQVVNFTIPTANAAKANCQPANCQPANCNPANCDKTQCDPAACPKNKAKGEKMQ